MANRGLDQKRTDWEVGAWYHNPMMEKCGTTKARYVKISSANTTLYDSCTAFQFDEYILPSGYHGKNLLLTQYNSIFETDMVKMDNVLIAKEVKRKRFGL